MNRELSTFNGIKLIRRPSDVNQLEVGDRVIFERGDLKTVITYEGRRGNRLAFMYRMNEGAINSIRGRRDEIEAKGGHMSFRVRDQDIYSHADNSCTFCEKLVVLEAQR